MKPALLIGSTLLLAATVLVAQSPAPSAQQSAIAVTVAPSGESCPVSMHALQGRGSGLIAVKNQAPPNGISQRIHLILGDRRTAKIVSARVAVRGYSGKARMAQASSLSETTGDLTKTIEVSFAPEDNGVAADLELPGFTAVSSIRLESIVYSDGSAWKVGGGQACSIAPDTLVLVAAH
jgi:hypothetical protein